MSLLKTNAADNHSKQTRAKIVYKGQKIIKTIKDKIELVILEIFLSKKRWINFTATNLLSTKVGAVKIKVYKLKNILIKLDHI